jgi:hypothetical protein
MTGRQLLAWLQSLPATELDLPIFSCDADYGEDWPVSNGNPPRVEYNTERDIWTIYIHGGIQG